MNLKNMTAYQSFPAQAGNPQPVIPRAGGESRFCAGHRPLKNHTFSSTALYKHKVSYSFNQGSKDILVLTGKSKKADKIRQGVTGKTGDPIHRNYARPARTSPLSRFYCTLGLCFYGFFMIIRLLKNPSKKEA